MIFLKSPEGLPGVNFGAGAAVKRAAVVICLFFALAGLAACGSKDPDPPAPPESAGEPEPSIKWLEISVSYSDGSFLPSGSVLTVTLEDVSRADAPGEFIGETVLEVDGSPPYAASLGYNPGLIKKRRKYALRAVIRHYDRMLYTTDTIVDPFAQGTPDPVPLPVIRVPRSKDQAG